MCLFVLLIALKASNISLQNSVKNFLIVRYPAVDRSEEEGSNLRTHSGTYLYRSSWFQGLKCFICDVLLVRSSLSIDGFRYRWMRSQVHSVLLSVGASITGLDDR